MDGNNVLPFPTKIPQQDIEAIETIMMVFRAQEISFDQIESTTESLDALLARLRQEQDVEQIAEQVSSSAWRFRTVQLTYSLVTGKRLSLVLIDQGSYRFFHYRSEEISVGPSAKYR